jgi:hypothetical protein
MKLNSPLELRQPVFVAFVSGIAIEGYMVIPVRLISQYAVQKPLESLPLFIFGELRVNLAGIHFLGGEQIICKCSSGRALLCRCRSPHNRSFVRSLYGRLFIHESTTAFKGGFRYNPTTSAASGANTHTPDCAAAADKYPRAAECARRREHWDSAFRPRPVRPNGHARRRCLLPYSQHSVALRERSTAHVSSVRFFTMAAKIALFIS